MLVAIAEGEIVVCLGAFPIVIVLALVIVAVVSPVVSVRIWPVVIAGASTSR